MSNYGKARHVIDDISRLLVAMAENSERAEAMTRSHKYSNKQLTPAEIKEYDEDIQYMKMSFDMAKDEIITRLGRIKRPGTDTLARPASPLSPAPASIMSQADKDAFDRIGMLRGEHEDDNKAKRQKTSKETE